MQVPFDASIRLHVVPLQASNMAWHPPLLKYTQLENDFLEEKSTELSSRVAFFKCFSIDRNFDQHVPCNFATNSREEYANHLVSDHPSSRYGCLYCSESPILKQLKLFETEINLIRHIDTTHLYRAYQCNLCNYRAISSDHIFLHQTFAHKCTFSSCSILQCPFPKCSHLQLKHFFDRYKTHNAKVGAYQCVFCQATSFSCSGIVSHLIEVHPDFPMLYYLPNPEINHNICSIKNSNGHNSENLQPEMILPDDAHSNDDLQEGKFVCFFCSKFSDTFKLMKEHLLKDHLDINEPKSLMQGSPDDEFILNWIHNFLNMQNAYLLDENSLYECFFHDMCNICCNLSRSRPLSPIPPDSQGRLTTSMQKVHFILHSCFKPVKCNLCAHENQGDFWLPDLKRFIVMHLYHCHQAQVDAIPAFHDFELFNFVRLRELPEKEWQSNQKQILLNEQVITIYSTKSDVIRDNWKLANQRALKRLEDRYLQAIEDFDA